MQKKRRRDEGAEMLREGWERLKRRREREERRKKEAVSSGRMDVRGVSGWGRRWLIEEGKTLMEEKKKKKRGGFQGETDKEVVEWVLAGMIRREVWATEEVVAVMERWIEWVDRGGMNREDLRFVMERTRAFACCCCIVGLLAEVVKKGDEGSVAADLRACVAAWKTVRLG